MIVSWEFGCQRSGCSRKICWTLLRFFHNGKCQQGWSKLKLSGASNRECQHSLVACFSPVLKYVVSEHQWLVFLFFPCPFHLWLIFQVFPLRSDELRSVLQSQCSSCLQIYCRARHWSCGWCFPQQAPGQYLVKSCFWNLIIWIMLEKINKNYRNHRLKKNQTKCVLCVMTTRID